MKVKNDEEEKKKTGVKLASLLALSQGEREPTNCKHPFNFVSQ
jgi:hypothetical protein